MKWYNPFAFRPAQVAFWTTLLYIAVVVPIIYIQETVPSAPETPKPYPGVDLDDAWADLTTITKAFHPFNSKFNEEIREYLLERIQEILNANGVRWTSELSWRGISASNKEFAMANARDEESPLATIFNDLVSNVTVTLAKSSSIGTVDPTCGLGTYFEGSNLIVYIRGTDDDKGEWWKREPYEWSTDHHGTLVNAHFDSVSTGYGATDDGVGVVTILQIISYFTSPGNQPKHGIIALLNNGEEDYMWGSRSFGANPVMPFVHTFLNLEGAGAGGRAVLFRSTDLEVTQSYAKSPNPFGTVVGSDGFALGLIKSQTDYVIFNQVYGARGLDVAFYEPRSMYHTMQDDARHTSRASLWHMLSASIKTIESLSGKSGDRFVGPRPDKDVTKVQNGQGSDGVWFDFAGLKFAMFDLRTLFGWSLALLILTPLILLLVSWILTKNDKYYFFSNKVSSHDSVGGSDAVAINGWRGFFRFPLALIVAGGLVSGLALLLRKLNPLIVYSSSYAVWAMMVSLFYFALWTIMRGASAMRPSALHRGYVFIWLFIITWIVLIGVTVLEDRFRIAAGYPFVILHAATFLCLFISLCELFALPAKKDFSRWSQSPAPSGASVVSRESIRSRDRLSDTTRPSTSKAADEEPASADERTPLIISRSTTRSDNIPRTTFSTGYRHSLGSITDESHGQPQQNSPINHEPFHLEQAWAAQLPSWTWILQLLILGLPTAWFFGQLGLFLTVSLSATGADGSALLLPYAAISAFAILSLLPLAPFIHRVPHQVPLILLAVFAGTLLYSLIAFPFSSNSTYKILFQQTVNLDTGASNITIDGLEEFVRPIIAELPSSAKKEVKCMPSSRNLLTTCYYDGSAVLPNLQPDVVLPADTPVEKRFADLVSVNITQPDGPRSRRAVFEVDAANTKACFLIFHTKHVTKFDVEGGSEWDPRFGAYNEHGLCQVRLWRRDWDKAWKVAIEWDDIPESLEGAQQEVRVPAEQAEQALPLPVGGTGELRVREEAADETELEGEVSCMWADANVAGVMPAFEEVVQFSPVWVTVTKAGEGLVVGTKKFRL
ncbi:hypothetical protein jhhlp_002800 [Lomentospora prolificans]|uniref:Peptide hydrolase n=1 Tax=Lomentospora prolificans TaxID=41688 RepID=A0A2N3NF23_9PEZI|nr:hypothetical protein jhhlp_002800 [Lomentospora prolificans]